MATNPRDAARAIAMGRVAIGAAAIAVPGSLGRVLFGGDARRPATVLLARMAGARDLCLGTWALWALRQGGDGADAGAALAIGAGAACDVVDGVAAVAGDGLLGRTRMLQPVAAFPAAVLGAWATVGLLRTRRA